MKEEQFCAICGRSLGKWHGYEHAEVHARHIEYNHPEDYIRLAKIHYELENLEEEFKNLSGRYAREAMYYRKRR